MKAFLLICLFTGVWQDPACTSTQSINNFKGKHVCRILGGVGPCTDISQAADFCLRRDQEKQTIFQHYNQDFFFGDTCIGDKVQTWQCQKRGATCTCTNCQQCTPFWSVIPGGGPHLDSGPTLRSCDNQVCKLMAPPKPEEETKTCCLRKSVGGKEYNLVNS